MSLYTLLALPAAPPLSTMLVTLGYLGHRVVFTLLRLLKFLLIAPFTCHPLCRRFVAVRGFVADVTFTLLIFTCCTTFNNADNTWIAESLYITFLPPLVTVGRAMYNLNKNSLKTLEIKPSVVENLLSIHLKITGGTSKQPS